MAKIYRDIDEPIELEVLKQNAQLGNVPNVTTNNQTPTWSMATTLANIVSGETLTKIMGKISKAINDIISHIGNKSNPHSVTKSQIGLGNVENKSGATIRGEMTKSDVVNALGYTPPTSDTNTTYGVATSSTLGLVKSGTDITVDSSGNVSIVGGNVNTAQTLKNARKIAGVSFDGTKDITISYNNLTDKPTIPSGVQVIDNLTSSSTIASLSANQGRVLKEYLDKKVVVSSIQPSGQQTGDTWYQII